MASFYYKVKNRENKVVEGYVKAANFRQAASKLENRGFIIKPNFIIFNLT